MIKKDFQLEKKYLYVNSDLGVDMIGVSGETYHIPAGYFVFLVDEIKDYFTVSYVSFVVNDFDSGFKVECKDFIIKNIQTPFDLNVSSFVQTIGSINSSLFSINDFMRIIQNSTSMILNATLQANPIQNVGSLNLTGSGNKFVAYVPVIKSNFGGTLILDNLDVFGNEGHDGLSSILNENLFPFISQLVKKVSSSLCVDWVTSDVYSRKFDISVINSDGIVYNNVVFGKPVIKGFSVFGGIACRGNTYALGSDLNFDKSRSLMDYNLFKCVPVLGGFSITGSGNSFSFGDLDYYSCVGNRTYKTSISYKIEIPFSVVVPPKVLKE